MSVKAFDLLYDNHRTSMNKGQSWLNGAKRYKLTIYKGKLKPRKWYFFYFNAPWKDLEADVILTLGTDEKQYLIEIDR